MILEVIMNIIGVVIALIMLIGLLICLILGLTVLDYVLNTDLKQKLCDFMPKWSILYRLRQFVTHNIDELDNDIKAEETKQERQPVESLAIDVPEETIFPEHQDTNE